MYSNAYEIDIWFHMKRYTDGFTIAIFLISKMFVYKHTEAIEYVKK